MCPGIRLLAANERNWDRLPIALDGLADFDLDLRLSAASIKIGSAQLGRTAVAANMRGGKLNVTIGESQAFGGVAKGSFGLGSCQRRRRGHLAPAIRRRRSRQLPRPILRRAQARRPRHARASMSTASGNSVLAVTRTLNGTASLNAQRRRARRASMSSNCCAGWNGGRCPAAAISAAAARRSTNSC